MDRKDQFLGHDPHDFSALAKAWQKLAAERGWSCEAFAQMDGYELLTVTNGSGNTDGFYDSAGIHGDEAAGCWALLEWARTSAEPLDTLPLRLFPCLNPWGLDANLRTNAAGEDLNRCFHDGNHPLVRAWRTVLGRQRFSCAVCLHEDYDAKGIYLYELGRGDALGGVLLAECDEFLERQPDGMVEELETEHGLVRLPADLDRELEKMGEQLPESVYLYLHHAERSFTFETPSELGWRDRVLSHVSFLAAVEKRSLMRRGGAASKS